MKRREPRSRYGSQAESRVSRQESGRAARADFRDDAGTAFRRNNSQGLRQEGLIGSRPHPKIQTFHWAVETSQLHLLRICSTFAFTAASILMSGGQGRLKPSPGNFLVASMPSLLPLAISLVVPTKAGSSANDLDAKAILLNCPRPKAVFFGCHEDFS